MHNSTFLLGLASLYAAPAILQPQSAAVTPKSLARFEGTWRIDTSRDEYGGRPVSRFIKDGIYRCGNCVTKVEVPADGRFHSFAGGQDFDAVAVSIRGPRQVDFQYRKAGRLAEKVSEHVSADGNTLTFRNVNLTSPDGKPITIEGQRARIGVLPVDAHPVSGDWRPLSGSKEAAEALTLTIRANGDDVTIIQPTGRSVSARVGGPAVPIIGDQAGRTMRIETPGPNALRTTTSIAGKDVQVGLIMVAADGRSLTFEVQDLGLGQTIKFVAVKQ
jgi:hypothetical protein